MSNVGCSCDSGYAGWTCANSVPVKSGNGGAVAGGVIASLAVVGACAFAFYKRCVPLCRPFVFSLLCACLITSTVCVDGVAATPSGRGGPEVAAAASPSSQPARRRVIRRPLRRTVLGLLPAAAHSTSLLRLARTARCDLFDWSLARIVLLHHRSVGVFCDDSGGANLRFTLFRFVSQVCVFALCFFVVTLTHTSTHNCCSTHAWPAYDDCDLPPAAPICDRMRASILGKISVWSAAHLEAQAVARACAAEISLWLGAAEVMLSRAESLQPAKHRCTRVCTCKAQRVCDKCPAWRCHRPVPEAAALRLEQSCPRTATGTGTLPRRTGSHPQIDGRHQSTRTRTCTWHAAGRTGGERNEQL